jgi:hypothetical protein
VTAVSEKPTDDEMRRFLAGCNARRLGWQLFQKGTRRSAQRMLREPMTALDAYLAAQFLADDGHLDSDAVTTADIDTAADLAGAQRPADSDDRHTVRLALDTIGEPR